MHADTLNFCNVTFFFIHSFLPLSHSPLRFLFAFYFLSFFIKIKKCFYTCHEGSGGVAPRILYLDAGDDWSVSRSFRFFFRKYAPGGSLLEPWWTSESAWVICCGVETSLWA